MRYCFLLSGKLAVFRSNNKSAFCFKYASLRTLFSFLRVLRLVVSLSICDLPSTTASLTDSLIKEESTARTFLKLLSTSLAVRFLVASSIAWVGTDSVIYSSK